MPDIKDTLLNKLLTDWLDNWKDRMPDRWVERFGEQVPRKWLARFEQAERNWLEASLETADALNELCHSNNKEIWDKLNEYLKRKYGRRAEGIRGQHTWEKPASRNPVRAQAINDPISWKYFLSQAIDILLAKIPCYSENSMYSNMVLHIEFILEDLVANAYKAELHGRKQPQNWEDFRDLAIELLLEGKRHWNRSSIEELVKNNAANYDIYWSKKGSNNAKIFAIAIEKVVRSLVSAAYEHEERVRLKYAENTNNANADNEELETITDNEQNLYSVVDLLDHLKNVNDDQELVQFATYLLENDEELIVVRRPHKHRVTVVFKSDKEIALKLGYPVKKLRELKAKLKKALECFKIDVDVSL